LQLPTPSSNIGAFGALLAQQQRLQQVVSAHSVSLNRRVDEHHLPSADAAAVTGMVATLQINASGIAALQSNLAGLQNNSVTLPSPLSFPASTPFSIALPHVQGQQYTEQAQQTLLLRLLLLTNELCRPNTNTTSM